MGYVVANFLLFIFATLNLIWDIFTLPVYYLIQSPGKKRRLNERLRSASCVISDTEIHCTSVAENESQFVRQMEEEGVDTLVKLFDLSSRDPQKSSRPQLGTRQIVRMEEEKNPKTGKVFTKLVLGDYQWISLKQVNANSKNFGLGLRALDVPARSKVAIYADTRAEWLVAARGCFQHSMVLCTLYTNLGLDAVEYGVGLTEAKVVVTSQELLPKLAKIIDRCPTVTHVVAFEEPWRGDLPHSISELNERMGDRKVSLMPYEEVVRLGEKRSGERKSADLLDALPQGDDPAIIMFTSGSTGVPKGVVLTHSNITVAFKSVLSFLHEALGKRRAAPENEIFIAFLPLAHILEFLAESVMLTLGVKIGYSSPNTLMDTGTMIKKGAKGDLSVLRPTFMCGVPVMLDRIYKGVLAKIKAKGTFSYKLFEYAVDYRTLWLERGYDTPLFDKFLFRAVRDVTGGRLARIIVGGAPLSGTTHQFVRQALGVDLMQGYGLTETCATGTIMDVHDAVGVEIVGPPLTGVHIKLRSWEEGNYTIHDKVGPRGEIIIGGKHIAQGYFKNEEATFESFEDDLETGIRWFKSGDVGQMMPDGSLKIIDRKKDLVKLQAGEYLSLGKVEGVLKLHPMVDNVCVFAKSTESFAVAVIVPSKADLIEFCEEVCHKTGFTAEQLAEDESVLDGIAKSMLSYGVSKGLEKFEVPRQFAVVFDEWTPDSGLVTAAMKLRRKPVEDKYQDQINRLYERLNTNARSALRPHSKISPA